MTAKAHKLYVGLFFLIGITSALFLAVNGYVYYSLPVEERFFSSSHSLLKPSGLWGHAFGIIGSLMMIFGVAVYMLRKRMKSLMNLGYLKYWLEFHIFLCTLGPVFVLYHTAFKFGGIVSISFWSMATVVISGVAGRFIYLQIPRKISGQEISLQELNETRLELDRKLAAVPLQKELLDPLKAINDIDKFKNINFSSGLHIYFKDLILQRSLIKKLKSEPGNTVLSQNEKKEIIKTVKAKLIISRRIGLLRISQKAFKYWHIFHLPFAIIMFLIMLIHIIITVAFGYRWIF